MTSGPNQQIVMTPDSAFRQWKNAVLDLRRAEERVAQNRAGALGDIARADERVTQARSFWVQNMLADFESRRAAADLEQLDVRSHAVLFSLGVPCIDCCGIAVSRTGHTIKFGAAGTVFPVWAVCGKPAIDPTTDPMPTPPAPGGKKR